MTDPVSPAHRNGGKFTRGRQRRTAFLSALSEPGSVAHCVVLIAADVAGRATVPTMPRRGRREGG